ncbi:trimeric intracellular cation channel family protein [Terriglobus tenax]|uniref:trimeric intracellular cation channel family protein n=1 Tax=Terriglobus tenax TaxID=1111115 RepID=UPI0021E0E53D|nr:TRIC cation channel family protein [Terriglobus tenax]
MLPGLPHAPIRTATVSMVIEYLALGVGAFAGALSVRRDQRYHYDWMGVLGLGLISGVGGGVTRDLILQQGVPLSFEHPSYLTCALGGATLALFFGSVVGVRVQRFIFIIDAVSLGLFAVAGATRAQDAGLAFLPCLLLGITTAVGGGALRDVFSGRTPAVFERGEPYAIAATVAAATYLGAERFGLSTETSSTLGTVTGFLLRLLSNVFGWRTPSMRLNRKA